MLKTLPVDHFRLRKIDIATEDDLIERYGRSIPVLAKSGKNAVQIELFWPFDENKIIDFLTQE